MKLSAETRKDAKKYNAMYDIFEGYNHETGESTYYASYGVAYRYCNDKVRRGIPMTIFGHALVEDPTDELGFRPVMDELITC